MNIKRILLPLPGTGDHGSAIETALVTAAALQGHVEAQFTTERRQPAQGAEPEGWGYQALAATEVNWYAEERERHAHDARERFARACTAAGIPLVPALEPQSTLPAASWREAEGSYVDTALARVAAFDLLVAASAAVMEPLMAIAGQSLLRTRRPVLLAPSKSESDLTDTAMVAWDESPECWHAVSAAIPIPSPCQGGPGGQHRPICRPPHRLPGRGIDLSALPRHCRDCAGDCPPFALHGR